MNSSRYVVGRGTLILTPRPAWHAPRCGRGTASLLSRLEFAPKTYSRLMQVSCEQLGMQPVCDHSSFCKDDERALFIGQTGSIANPNERATASPWYLDNAKTGGLALSNTVCEHDKL